MATEKLAEGIRAFAADAVKLEKLMESAHDQATLRSHARPGAGSQEHYDAAGRDFDLRAGLRRRRRRASSAFSQSAPHLFADLSKNLIDAADRGTAARPGARMRASRRTATRCSPASTSTRPKTAPCCTPCCDARRRRRSPSRWQASWPRCMPRWMPCWPTPSRCAATTRSPTWSTSASAAPTSGRRWRCWRSTHYVAPGKRFHFVSNVDGHELAGVLRGLAPEHTLFLIASKTFTTAETMANAQSAKRWFEQSGSVDVARHFAALTTNVEAARAFGIETTFGFWDWVGGRYSLWSAIGLPIALAIGADGFRAPAGRRPRDGRAFPHRAAGAEPAGAPGPARRLVSQLPRLHEPQHRALPQRAEARCRPTCSSWRWKATASRSTLAGEALPFGTSPVLWGEPGTNGQHAYFQMLHQGTDVMPLEFIAVRDAGARTGRPPCQAAGQCAGAGAGADGRQA